MFGFLTRSSTGAKNECPPLFLHNTRSGEKEEFTLPSPARTVRMYNCGPTLYGRQHIGNLSMFVFTDVLRRALEYNGFTVKQVINFTDFGHLTSDADEGEDKMTKGLKREKLALTLPNMRMLAEKYAALFLEDLRELGVAVDTITFPYASDYVEAQIAMIKTLEEKGYAYRLEDGVYFDTARFPRYGQLGGIALEGQEEGARVAARESKRSPTDFVLWKSDKKLGWESPWGRGFPGWHIECSAMARSLLGEQIDIHTGGIEHVPIHHNNEIAQSECATGRSPFSRFWLHRAHIQIEGGKIAKSKGNVIYLPDITAAHHPMALRYLFLGAHYRTPMNFSFESLAAVQKAFLRMRHAVDSAEAGGAAPEAHMRRFRERINDDLDTPGAIAVLWDMLKEGSLSPADKRAGLLEADSVLGLGFGAPDQRAAQMCAALVGEEIAEGDLPAEAREILARRAEARERRDWILSDTLREELAALGYAVEDTAQGVRIFRREA